MGRKPGGLIRHSDLSDTQREMLADLLDCMSEGNVFRSLEYLTQGTFLEILDLCQGDKIEFPTLEEIERRIECVKVYSEWKRCRNIQSVAVRFKKTARWVDKMVEAVCKDLTEVDSEYV